MEKKAAINKSQLNIIIDLLLLLILSVVLGIGLLVKYVLITGEEKILRFGVNFSQTIWGMDRHEWGDIHLYFGYIMLALLLMHIFFHWRTIITMLSNFSRNSILRKTLIIVLLGLCFTCVIMPFFMNTYNNVQSTHVDRRYEHLRKDSLQFKKDNANSYTPKNEERHDRHNKFYKSMNFEVKGYMTISEVCNVFKFSEEYFKEKLKIPSETPGNTRLSSLRKLYDIKMGEIKEMIAMNNNSKAERGINND